MADLSTFTLTLSGVLVGGLLSAGGQRWLAVLERRDRRVERKEAALAREAEEQAAVIFEITEALLEYQVAAIPLIQTSRGPDEMIPVEGLLEGPFGRFRETGTRLRILHVRLHDAAVRALIQAHVNLVSAAALDSDADREKLAVGGDLLDRVLTSTADLVAALGVVARHLRLSGPP